MAETEQLQQAIAALEAQRATLGDAVVDAALAPLREKLDTLKAQQWPAAEQQRKHITVLFADVSGFTAMSEKMDAEDLTNLMNGLWHRLDTAIISHGGRVTAHIGDAVMALWGVNAAREDDPEQAIRAALAMHTAIRAFTSEMKHDLQMRIGLNTGPVLLGTIGTTGEFTAMGDTVNVASRLEHAAPVGGILISHDTYRHVRGIFDVEQLEPLAVKGKIAPLQVYRVLQAKPRAFRVATRGVEGVETRMVGREVELKCLQDALDAAIGGSGQQVVTVVAEAGMGKSRLLYEFNNWLELLPETVLYFKGRSSASLQNLPYALLRDLFSARFQIQDSDSPQIVRDNMERNFGEVYQKDAQLRAHIIGFVLGFEFGESPHVYGLRADAKQARDRALAYLRDYFGQLADRNPTVILLEDIHWADDSSLDLLNDLILSLADKRLLIVCATRPTLFERRPHWGEGQPFHARLVLSGLSATDSHRLVREVLQKAEEIPSALSDLVVGNAEGNPFYMEELIKMLIEDDVIVKGAERWRVEPTRLAAVRVPPTLTGVLQARLDSLSPEERGLLQRASVVGRIFWDRAVKALESQTADNPLWQNSLTVLCARELIFQRGKSTFENTEEYIFRHALLRDVAYESVLKRLRRIYHSHAASWLAEVTGRSGRGDEYAALIADHYEQAGEKETARTWYQRAGAQAAAQFANAEAIRCLSQALALTPESEDAARYELLLAREKVYDMQAARQAQSQDLDALSALADKLGDTQKRAEVALRRAGLAEVLSDYQASIGAARQAIDFAQAAGTIKSVAAGYLLWGVALWRMGDYAASHDNLEKALALAREHEVRDVEARSLLNLGNLTDDEGKSTEARSYYEQALRLFDELGDQRGKTNTLNSLGIVIQNQGDPSGARGYYEQVLHFARQYGDRRSEIKGLINLGNIFWDKGDYRTARSHFERAARVGHETGDRRNEGMAVGNIGGVMFHQGDFTGAQVHFEQSRQIAHEINDPIGEGNALCNLGDITGLLGDYAKAQSYYQQALHLFRETGNRRGECFVLDNAGKVNFLVGHYIQAQAYWEQALQLKRAIDLRLNESVTVANLAVVFHYGGHHQTALEYSQQALKLAQAVGARPDEAYAWLVTGDVRVGHADFDGAMDAYHRAQNLRRDLGQQNLAIETVSRLAALSLAQGDLPGAMTHVSEILGYQESSSLEGIEEPIRIYLTCYNVLKACSDGRAPGILQMAYDLLQERASKITDESLRHMFLNNVPAHRKLVTAYSKQHPG